MRYQSHSLTVIKGARTHRGYVVGLGIALCLGISLAPMVATAGTATEAVKSTIDQVVRLLEDKELKKPERAMERRHQLQKIIGDRFSYEEMAKRSLGAHWNQLNETQRQEFTELFQQLLLRTYTARIEAYSGEQTQYLGERNEGDYAEVRTKLIARKGELPIDYRLLSNSGGWHVYDIVVDGISMASNYRGQFTNIIRTSSYEDLVKKLKNKTETFKPPTKEK
jgi:phospholipid transport system substrate-binding protein